jgi:hypothetical protein
MQNILKTVLFVAAIATATSAFAGRDDLQLNMQAQSNKAAANKSESSTATSAVGKSHPLDHGPRATTTQWQNKQQTSATTTDTK